MKKAKWIWCDKENSVDNYAEFIEHFSIEDCKNKKVTLEVACDSIFYATLNDKLVGFSACADFPHYKFFNKIDITSFVEKENTLKIAVWHLGDNSQVYIKDNEGVIFEVLDGENVLSYSNENTLSRKMIEYKNGFCKKITSQLGYTFYYDNVKEKGDYKKSVEVEKTYDLHLRNINNLKLEDRLPIKIKRTENSILIDMGKEVAGFIDLDFNSEIDQEITFTYGEHLADGKVRRIIDARDFSFFVNAKKGENKYINYFRRIAGRYVEIFAKEDIDINYIGIRPVMYPQEEKPFKLQDSLLQKIYDTCIYTLKCCMHEHYEDCPWREQALYAMDSRNQMLCGYYAFKGFNYQRHNLITISKGLRKDGLLSICAPSGNDVPIPSFSLVYIMQVYEYIKYSGDKDVLKEVGTTLDAIINAFISKIDKTGLIPSFPYPYWNFYEWADYSNNGWQVTRSAQDKYTLAYDLILNCLFVRVVEYYSEMRGKSFDTKNIKDTIDKTFKFNGEYKLSTDINATSELGNSMALYIGLGGKELADKIVEGKNMVKVTLSMTTFVYDALLKFGDQYKDYIINDIKKKYSYMLDQGATTFWETEIGQADFGNAGSLCHGWSAMPVYYLHTLFNK